MGQKSLLGCFDLRWPRWSQSVEAIVDCHNNGTSQVPLRFIRNRDNNTFLQRDYEDSRYRLQKPKRRLLSTILGLVLRAAHHLRPFPNYQRSLRRPPPFSPWPATAPQLALAACLTHSFARHAMSFDERARSLSLLGRIHHLPSRQRETAARFWSQISTRNGQE